MWQFLIFKAVSDHFGRLIFIFYIYLSLKNGTNVEILSNKIKCGKYLKIYNTEKASSQKIWQLQVMQKIAPGKKNKNANKKYLFFLESICRYFTTSHYNISNLQHITSYLKSIHFYLTFLSISVLPSRSLSIRTSLYI